jgi:hypothetical protein
MASNEPREGYQFQLLGLAERYEQLAENIEQWKSRHTKSPSPIF